ncbi:MAG TPA: monovalent cation/H(+) antiporter subunit G [Candidatus Latescibacteria bacterium]|jgi:multicomponent Na+:H+ antiporter subunit G|nr:sodium:proton antiporter [Gemmatimonadaceae bacterium]MDP6017970.1 monovalent cation/H(+) antiporter subunit G [Candidatus Latescibacterota bacterium]HJP32481.1 monovalent cation/H(+) antiporter subunit G [Candidatus Latescibacterota bacterium]
MAPVDIASWILLMGGAVFCVIGGIGLHRLPDFFSRMHGAGITDTLGAGLIIFGLVLQAGLTLIAVKLLFILGLLWLTSPTSTHAIARAALASGLEPFTGLQADSSGSADDESSAA